MEEVFLKGDDNMADSNLFYMVMEAEGDDLLQPMDLSTDTAENPTETPPQDSQTGSNDNPPPLEEMNNADALSFPGDNGGGDNQDTENNTDDNNDENAEENDEDQQLSDKANNVLNKTLYDKFIQRNEEVSSILENLQIIIPVLPVEIVDENEKDVNNLKAALAAGQNYVIEKFVDAKYGENALYFRKLDTLYTLLMDRINSNLKKADKKESA